MADLVELSDAEHLFEYARQIVRCDAEINRMGEVPAVDLMNSSRTQAMEYTVLPYDFGSARREMDKLAEMIAGLTSGKG